MNDNRYNGFLNVYKEPGWTSMDVVARLRSVLHMRKIGHAGTLDPMAEGVLPVALGRATRNIDAAGDGMKIYEAEMLLGRTTDTQDITGKVLEEFSGELPGEDEIRKAALSFTGGYDQLTPMYSARKVKGRKLYSYARAGREVERPVKHVDIRNIEILDINLPYVNLRVHCGKGTYIRTLCHDIGERLGCGASMSALKRTFAGGFASEDGIRLRDIEALNGDIDSLLTVKTGTALALGNFDGTHIGHKYLVKELKKTAQELKLRTCVLILDTGTAGISSAEERRRFFLGEDIDYCFVMKLDSELMNMEAEDFIQKVLIGRFSMKAIVGGKDLTFGKNRAGNGDYLKANSGRLGIEVRLLNKLREETEEGDVEVSSTLIRRLIDEGKTELADRFLHT